ncbi:MAG: HD domain-containing protein [Pseudomonas sp.]|uniref:HD domain-containing protein n=1 Tax=Pseudomonas sp. TaxID=306 RepID=UPI003390FDEF
MTDQPFAPYQPLAELLLRQAPQPQDDGSHDDSHLQRVWNNARLIQGQEGGDLQVLLAATVLHDCVAVDKNSPLRAQASRLSAERASEMLAALGWPAPRVAAVAHAVHAHSFSAAVQPTSLEARILQDADRLDALGMLGVARCFYVAGRLGSALYDLSNPWAMGRDYQDSRYAIEHFPAKLLTLSAGFQTTEGARLAAIRQRRLQRFFEEFMQEIGIPGAASMTGCEPPNPMRE